MSNAAQMTGLPRSTICAWVEREERRTGSRMVAYHNVAATVGTSAEWVRNFYKGSVKAKEPGWTLGCNILDAYGRICSRLERAEQAEAEQAANLKRQIHEVAARTLEMVEGEARTPPPRKRTAKN